MKKKDILQIDIPCRDTYIIEFTKDDKTFICNRNSDMYDNLFNDKYIKFWGVNEISKLDTSMCDNWKIINILYGIDNYNRRHQAIINNIKKQYINKYIEADEDLTNSQFVEISKSYRKYYKKQYDMFYLRLLLINNIYDKIYEMSKKLFYKNNIEYLKNNSYWNIWKDERMSIEQRILIIILRDYIYDRKINNKKYPYDKGNIKTTIKILINKFIHKL